MSKKIHMTGSLRVWFEITDGRVTAIELRRDTLIAEGAVGLAYSTEPGEDEDLDLDAQQIHAAVLLVGNSDLEIDPEKWDLLKIEDDYGRVYLDEDPT